MPTLLQDIFCLGVVTYASATDWVLPVLLLHYAHFAPKHIVVTYAGAADWVLPVLLLHHAHFAPGCIACPGVLLGRCCCCSYPVLIQQTNVFDLPVLVWALLLGAISHVPTWLQD